MADLYDFNKMVNKRFLATLPKNVRNELCEGDVTTAKITAVTRNGGVDVGRKTQAQGQVFEKL